ncbi:TRAP transporter small permease [Glaesserella parasuis]|uniref:TRAP transporter small permease protein n=1 Tax=Glaesserella parasuis TaxID=738 RepID=A0AAX1M5Z9_GLAPU|nr:TRAP transporter small permease [Glaesserella parasuis]EPZ99458.1 2,3-diketo-L-gulonate TRAP transporter small permease protein yiaM [Glaesserella parasuis MN-H]EQA04936.1 2,3-diketo-L-gulonate TRAP transporter small permease protein yiaM [Glaesserella parasuis 12939]EQA12763.1 2,3-diketo-L-gulonate TRAP transporter small permease protein yiaM [Glaesserella parasuis SW140]MCT8518155.1 TRAP transporter small permease [Glaesserella parasuis]MCT8543532.1 TRAP transporter small permease [Glaess
MKSLALYTSKALEFLVVNILSTMACLVFLNVVLRYGFNSSINITEEVSRYLFVWLTFLGAILAFSDNQHVSVTMLTDKLSPTTRHILRLFTDSIMLFCCYLVVQGGWVQFQLNLHNLSPISEIPTGVTYLAAVISGVFIAILIATRVISTAAILIRGETK